MFRRAHEPATDPQRRARAAIAFAAHQLSDELTADQIDSRAARRFTDASAGQGVIMLTILLIIVVILLLTGGGYGYSRSRRGV